MARGGRPTLENAAIEGEAEAATALVDACKRPEAEMQHSLSDLTNLKFDDKKRSLVNRNQT